MIMYMEFALYKCQLFRLLLFSKGTARMKSWLSQGSSVSRGTLLPCKQGLKATEMRGYPGFKHKGLLFPPSHKPCKNTFELVGTSRDAQNVCAVAKGGASSQ